MKKKEIRPSIIDRLTHPERLDESASYYSINELRESVQADLQALLNARVRFLSPEKSQSYAQNTLLNYGLPEMTAQSLVSEEGKREFSEWIERAIRRFEPRFKHVKVTLGDRYSNRSATDLGGFIFRVDAVLFADPAPEEVSFDSRIDPINQTITLRESYR